MLAPLDDRFIRRFSGRRIALPKRETLWATLNWSFVLVPAPMKFLRGAVTAEGIVNFVAKSVVSDDKVGVDLRIRRDARAVSARSTMTIHSPNPTQYRLQTGITAFGERSASFNTSARR
jgi:predicted ATPase